MTDLTFALIGAAFGGLITYLLAIQKARLELDEATRADRAKAYKDLWKLTGLLPLYPPAPNVVYQDLVSLSESLRKWYFETGGMYLSQPTRDVYFDVQKYIATLSKKEGSLSPYDNKGAYDKQSDYEKMRARLSALRTQLTSDIGSRRPPSFTLPTE
ncbi:MAG: hypothetical protein H7175_07290 [Burkholderiales bacterium]|nr:hypothetical protein [Anaerolineae bacterium]